MPPGSLGPGCRAGVLLPMGMWARRGATCLSYPRAGRRGRPRLRQIGSREAVQQMVYDQLRIFGATQRTTSQLTNANGQVERQMSRSHHPVEKAMALIPVRDARQSYPPFDAVFSPFKHGSIRYGRTASAADRAVLVELRRFLAVNHATGTLPSGPRLIGTRVCGLSRPGGRRRTASTGCRCAPGPWRF